MAVKRLKVKTEIKRQIKSINSKDGLFPPLLNAQYGWHTTSAKSLSVNTKKETNGFCI